MKILAHRGYWDSGVPNNTPAAVRRALEHGFGFESDIRDFNGELVISHNIANETCQKAEEVFSWPAEFDDRYCFAINIKADGLKEKLAELLKKYDVRNYFTFDMSVPQMVEYAEVGIKYFTRQSEIETTPILYENAGGVWADGFWSTDWINEELLKNHIKNEKTVCIVSPELHKREYKSFWEKLVRFDVDFSRIMLCTDCPREAKQFFQNKL